MERSFSRQTGQSSGEAQYKYYPRAQSTHHMVFVRSVAINTIRENVNFQISFAVAS